MRKIINRITKLVKTGKITKDKVIDWLDSLEKENYDTEYLRLSQELEHQKELTERGGVGFMIDGDCTIKEISIEPRLEEYNKSIPILFRQLSKKDTMNNLIHFLKSHWYDLHLISSSPIQLVDPGLQIIKDSNIFCIDLTKDEYLEIYRILGLGFRTNSCDSK